MDRSLFAAWCTPSLFQDPLNRIFALGTPTFAGPELTDDNAGELRGNFSLVAGLEGGDTEMLMARGGMGGESLFLATENDGATLIVSSRIQLILAGLSRRPDIAVDRLAEFAADIYVPESRETFHRGVTRLNSYEIVKAGRRGIERASIAPRRIVDARGTPSELASELRDRLFATVRDRVQTSARTAVFAGGGLDSSGVLAAAVAAARGAGKPEVTAVALDFAGQGDDRPYMKDLVRELGIVPIRVAPRSCARWVRRSFVIDATPISFATEPFALQMAERAKESGADLLLSGVQGDGVFGGNPRILGIEGRRHPLRAIAAALRLRVPWTTSRVSRVANFAVRPMLRPFVPWTLHRHLWRRRHRTTLPWAGPTTAKALAKQRDIWLPKAEDDFSTRARFEQFSRSPLLLETADDRQHIEALVGCRRVDPLLDEDFFAFMASIPPMMLFHGDEYRGLFRLAMRDVLPESICRRQDKAYFENAIADLLDAAGGMSAFADVARATSLETLGIVDVRRFERVFESLRGVNGTSIEMGMRWAQVWRVMAAESFARSEGIDRGAA